MNVYKPYGSLQRYWYIHSWPKVWHHSKCSVKSPWWRKYDSIMIGMFWFWFHQYGPFDIFLHYTKNLIWENRPHCRKIAIFHKWYQFNWCQTFGHESWGVYTLNRNLIMTRHCKVTLHCKEDRRWKRVFWIWWAFSCHTSASSTIWVFVCRHCPTFGEHPNPS